MGRKTGLRKQDSHLSREYKGLGKKARVVLAERFFRRGGIAQPLQHGLICSKIGVIAPQYAPDACDLMNGSLALAMQQDGVCRLKVKTQAVAECLSIQARLAFF